MYKNEKIFQFFANLILALLTIWLCGSVSFDDFRVIQF